jgi:hypothetical protein
MGMDTMLVDRMGTDRKWLLKGVSGPCSAL